jgi:hypothetical protein
MNPAGLGLLLAAIAGSQKPSRLDRGPLRRQRGVHDLVGLYALGCRRRGVGDVRLAAQEHDRTDHAYRDDQTGSQEATQVRCFRGHGR